ncbi:MAG TPA: hypothetical protein VGT61_14190 [Thermomicrobiales bacterium]|jgi:hypothetical protein|nr:hypothetical protein [Thermomicrobiales bacterium]
MSTYTVYRYAAKADTLTETIVMARDKYAARQHRPPTEARVNSAVVVELGTIEGLTIIGDDRVQPGEVWLTDDQRPG